MAGAWSGRVAQAVFGDSVGAWASEAAASVSSRYAASRAASTRLAGADYVGGWADFASGAASRAAGMGAPGAPSAAGTVGELTGAAARGYVASGSNYETTQQASFAANGGMAGMPYSPQAMSAAAAMMGRIYGTG